jgi:hypothetical protein
MAMAELIKALAANDKDSVGLLAAAFIVLGGLLIIGGLVYRVFVQPEWTFEEAGSALWPFFLAGIVSLTLGWFIDRTQN